MINPFRVLTVGKVSYENFQHYIEEKEASLWDSIPATPSTIFEIEYDTYIKHIIQITIK